MTKKAFIFDLDGVIVDTARYHYLAWQKIANELGIEFTPEHNEHLKGVSRIKSLDIILALGKIEGTQSEKDIWLKQKNEDYLSYLKDIDNSEVLPGVMPILEYLKEKNQPIALGSASKNARPILEKTGIIKYFDAIVLSRLGEAALDAAKIGESFAYFFVRHAKFARHNKGGGGIQGVVVAWHVQGQISDVPGLAGNTFGDAHGKARGVVLVMHVHQTVVGLR